MNSEHYDLPPEWAAQDRLLIGWPSHYAPWGKPFQAARAEVAKLANLIIAAGKRFDGAATQVTLVLEGDDAESAARDMVPGAEIISTVCGDAWLRDTSAIFARRGEDLHALSFQFNGWGGKYIYPGDADLSVRLGRVMNARLREFDFVLEGGSVDWDGEGRLLTTDECLLNPNRNLGWTRKNAEAALRGAFGVTDIVWIEHGLINDHTDGHIDNLARFVGPGHVLCQSPSEDDLHAERLTRVEQTLRAYSGEQGGLKVSTLPAPGRVLDEGGDIMPASHMNFVVTNQAVILPAYNERSETARVALGPLFPGREVFASPASALLTGGGSFHCITQQIPARIGG